MSRHDEAVWKDKPTVFSFLGVYLLYSLPLLSLVLAHLLWLGLPAEFKTQLQTLSPILLWITMLHFPSSLIYVSAFLISTALGVLNWIVRVDIKPLVFTLGGFVVVEATRRLSIVPGDFNTLILLFLAYSLIGVLGVDLYRRSFTYYVFPDTIVIKGGFVNKWERVVRKDFVSDVVVIVPFLGHLFGYAHILPVTQSQIGLGDTFSLSGVSVEKRGVGVLVGGGKRVVGVEPRPWNCIFGVRNYNDVKRAILER
ncbi:hypothetical protein MA03_01150 [Infirmifilum uzonense]|uniref:YdbS-like PH domain-containing protein n=1 Tax=Infirmifilum uzonense TaxID=1550241 RepID=A0A0F7FGA6_9CREN|nr:PH domain-containing protein [Infirmifilum uzonense]AKG38170.1 hypothetical protein MA03_01150 [Infirmifilum uzonense]